MFLLHCTFLLYTLWGDVCPTSLFTQSYVALAPELMRTDEFCGKWQGWGVALVTNSVIRVTANNSQNIMNHIIILLNARISHPICSNFTSFPNPRGATAPLLPPCPVRL